jgi:hypothetical protein
MRTDIAAACAIALHAWSQAGAPETDAIVALASAYVAGYESTLGGIVAQEEYRQDLPQLTRRLKSDFMLVRFTNDGPWIPFRDVIEVDGKPVGDRQSRLEQLFLTADPRARDNAEQISRESARYNLGRSYRNTNMPLIGLEYLRPRNLARSRFEKPRREVVEGVNAWKMDFKEGPRETVIRDGDRRALPASGTMWIRATDGAVMRTVVRVGTLTLESVIDVTYCAAPAIAVLVPCRMVESVRAQGERITSVATYTNIRQFKVSTTESIKD